MKTVALVLLVAAGLVAQQAYAGCTYPTAPDKIPDGTTATMEEMVASKNQVSQYNKDMEAYLSCLKLEHEGKVAEAGDTITPEQKKELDRMQVQKHNAAIDELEAVASQFNEQLRAYNAKNKKN
ncbi:MAG: hypothetical protein R3F58_15480 [Steroidobacteraceae bacterium]|nr:hypothetical protein [Steroidobacteraceae bacterium]